MFAPVEESKVEGREWAFELFDLRHSTFDQQVPEPNADAMA
jgi:hypothetical protein